MTCCFGLYSYSKSNEFAGLPHDSNDAFFLIQLRIIISATRRRRFTVMESLQKGY